MSRTFSFFCILASTAALSHSYFLAGYWIASIGFIVLGIVWILCQYYQYIWFSSWALFFLTAAAATGMWLGLTPILMALVVLIGLSAWDLTALYQRLGLFPSNKYIQEIERRHLYWLAITLVTGFILSNIAGLLNIQISFLLTLVLAIIATLGTVRIISWLRQS
jgi:hypothetical protein